MLLETVRPIAPSSAWENDLALCLEEHREVNDQIEAIQLFLRFCPKRALPDLSWGSELARLLRRLRRQLVRHFSAEERSALLAAAAPWFPGFGCRLAVLKEEHDALLASVDHLESHSRWATSVARAQNLKRRTLRFLIDLESHESTEDRIMRHAFDEDV